MAGNGNKSDETPRTRTARRVLLVDNDRAHAETMAEALQTTGYDCTVADSGPAGARCIAQDSFDVIVTDLVMNDVDGIEILKQAKETQSNCEVIVVTGHASIPKAVEAIKEGAFNFLEKPITPLRLRTVTDNASEQVSLRRRNEDLVQRLDERFGFEQIVHVSDQMRAVVDQLRRIAPTDLSVLITGPTGTGKDLIAQAIHQNSPRKNKPYVAMNCGAFPAHIVESELFGHVKGAFTDAHADRVGKFEYADGGTIFLDELGDMPKDIQIKLLRVLEQREIIRVGDNKPIKVNVRVISATNRDLEKAIAESEFREDLFYRLCAFTIELPALAERKEDIGPLVDFFRRQYSKRTDKNIKGVTPALMRRMWKADWPGNVRELRNQVETMIELDTDKLLDVNDIPPRSGLGKIQDDPQTEESFGLIGKSLSEIEYWAIEQTLQLTGGNREEAANILGIAPRTLYRKLKEQKEKSTDGEEE